MKKTDNTSLEAEPQAVVSKNMTPQFALRPFAGSIIKDAGYDCHVDLLSLNHNWVLIKCQGTPNLTSQFWIQNELDRLLPNGKTFGLVLLIDESDAGTESVNSWYRQSKFITRFKVVYGSENVINAHENFVWVPVSQPELNSETYEPELGTVKEVFSAGYEAELRNIRIEVLPSELANCLFIDRLPESDSNTAGHRPLTYIESLCLNYVQELEYQYFISNEQQRSQLIAQPDINLVLEALLDSSERAICIITKDAKVVMYNQSAFDLFSIRHGNKFGVGADMLSMLDSDQQEKLRLRIKRGSHGDIFTKVDSIKRGDGRLYLEYHYAPIFIQGAYFGLVLRVRDITAQRLLEQERQVRERQIRSLTEKVPGVIFQGRSDSTKGTTQFLYVSPSSKNYLGAYPDTITTDPTYLFKAAVDKVKWRQMEQQALKGQDLNYEGEFDLPNVGIRHLLFTAQVSFHTTTGYLYDGLIMDVTDRENALRKAQRSAERLAILIKTAPGVVFEIECNPDGIYRLTYISPGGAELIGIKHEDYSNTDLTNLPWLLAEVNTPAWERLRESRLTLKPWNDEFLIKRDQEHYWMSAQAIPQRQSDGTVCWRGMMVDVTNLKENETKLSRYAQALEEARTIAKLGSFDYIINEDGGQLENDRILLDMAGQPEEQAEKFNIFKDAVWVEDIDRVNEHFDSCLNSEHEFSLDYRLKRSDNTLVYLYVKAIFIKSEDGQLLIKGTCQDVSDRKELENTLVKAREEAEHASKAKTQFLSAMSHEIRTPLNAIIGINTLLQAEVQNAEVLDKLGTLEFCARNLLNTINKLLDLSKLEVGKFKVYRHPFDLAQLLNQIKDVYKLQADQKGLNFELEVPDVIPEALMGDENILSNILNNLLGNAVKYTEQGMICLSVIMLERKGRNFTYEFNIMDTGQGIPQDKQDLIFELYEQATLQDQSKGTGLGLALSKQLIESMDGKLSLSSVEGRGSTFSFTLTFQEISKSEQKTTQEEFRQSLIQTQDLLPQLAGCTILIAEDNAINAMIFKEFLKRWNIMYDHAVNGEEAILLAGQKNYEMIMMDIQMPVIDGIRATKIIRSLGDGWYKQVPIVAFSAYALQETANDAYEAGMSDYLLKPFTPEQVLDKFYKYLLPYKRARESQTSINFAHQPVIVTELNLNPLLKGISPKELDVLIMSLNELIDNLTEALHNDDAKHMQRLCHKYIPSLKMIGVGDVWIDLVIARQVIEGGQLTPELSQTYINRVQEKIDAFVLKVRQQASENAVVSD